MAAAMEGRQATDPSAVLQMMEKMERESDSEWISLSYCLQTRRTRGVPVISDSRSN